MNKMVNNVVRIPCNKGMNFYRFWLLLLKPLCKLTDRQIDIAACLLYHRFELSKLISDVAILDQMTLNNKTYEKVVVECDIVPSHLWVTIGKLRKRGFIINNKINPKFIPNMNGVTDSYSLMLLFDFKG